MRIIRLAACTASGALAAISAASACAAARHSSAGTTCETSPSSRHCAALSVRPVKISSVAFDQPIRRGRIQVPPDSGTTPRTVNDGAIFDSLAMMRMSQPSARSMP